MNTFSIAAASATVIFWLKGLLIATVLLFLTAFVFLNKYEDISKTFSPIRVSIQRILSLERSIETFFQEDVLEDLYSNVSSLPIDIECLSKTGVKDSNSKAGDEDYEFLKTDEGRRYKKILFYYHSYSNNNYIGYGHKTFADNCCKERRCFITDDKSKIAFDDFDAVIIEHSGFRISDLPKYKPKNQIWIFHERESAIYYVNGLTSYSGLFNWTMTYKRDSDIPFRYGHVFSKKRWPDTFITTLERKSLPLEELVKMKTKLVVWMASNCHTRSNRELFVKQLQSYIDIDVYGKCGPLKCPKKESYKCYENFEKTYKFFLSFENSICEDYASQKFFIMLKYNMVPVVLGGGDYSSMAPPHSYINARNFKNALELATYLKYLDSNNTAYMEYFRWKDNYVADERVLARKLGICTLCQKLHEENEVKVYEDMKNWYYEQSNCIECSEGKLKRNKNKNCYRENIIF